MQGAMKKMYLSILTAVLVLVTTITTTYAWFGTQSTHSVGDFELTFDSSSTEGLEISMDGINFTSYISSNEVKAAVLRKKGVSFNALTLESKFKEVASLTSTTALLQNNDLKFYDMYGATDLDNYLSFTFYVRPSYIVGPDDIPEEGIYNPDHAIDIFFKDNDIIRSKVVDTHMVNTVTHPVFGDINAISVNPVNATRFALKKYEVVDSIEEYNSNNFGETIIYNPGGNSYSHNQQTNLYNFGGITTDDYNVAVHDFNSKNKTNLTVPQNAIDRGNTDVDLDYNQIVDYQKDSLSINKIMKFDFYFWHEGWDADCFEAITLSKCSIGLTLTTLDPKNVSK